MNKLWRFGDSYSQVMYNRYPDEKNHSYWVAKYFGLEYVDRGAGGLSILDCLLRMIESSDDIKSGDMILFNMPNSDRLGFYDVELVKHNSSNFLKEELFLIDVYKELLTSDSYKYINHTLIGILSKFLEDKIKKGTRVYVFTNGGEDYKTYKIPNKVRFKENDGFIGAVKDMGFEDNSHKGNLHYLYGVQEHFAKRIIEVIQNTG